MSTHFVDRSAVISNNERQFIAEAVKEELRCDGRRPLDARKVRLSLHRAKQSATAEVSLGETKVFAVVAAEVVKPFPDRPTDGFLHLSVELSPMASAGFDGGRMSAQGIEIQRIIERSFRDSRAVDTEALCIVAGEKVWDVRVDVHVIDHRGNLADACAFAANAALLHFRRPDVSVRGTNVIIHDPDEREPVALSVHHTPFCHTFAFLEDGTVLLDPTDREELVMAGRMTVTTDAHREVCALQKLGSALVPVDVIMRCVNVAATRAQEMSTLLKKSLDTADEADRARRYSRPSTLAQALARGAQLPAQPGTFAAAVAEFVPTAAAGSDGGAPSGDGRAGVDMDGGSDGATRSWAAAVPTVPTQRLHGAGAPAAVAMEEDGDAVSSNDAAVRAEAGDQPESTADAAVRAATSALVGSQPPEGLQAAVRTAGAPSSDAQRKKKKNKRKKGKGGAGAAVATS